MTSQMNPEQPSPAPIALKACPFCGGPAALASNLEASGVTDHFAMCGVNCSIEPCTNACATEAEAITAWNQRAEPAGVRELVETWERTSEITLSAGLKNDEVLVVAAIQRNVDARELAALFGPQEMTDEAK